MASHESTSQAREAKREAERDRNRALQRVSDMCANGQRQLVLRFLIANMRHNPALAKIHLWQLDVAMFHVGRYKALRTVRRMRETIGDKSNVTDGVASLGWALAGREESVRMSTWLFLLLLREDLVRFEPPDGFPYAMLYGRDGDKGDDDGNMA